MYAGLRGTSDRLRGVHLFLVLAGELRYPNRPYVRLTDTIGKFHKYISAEVMSFLETRNAPDNLSENLARNDRQSTGRWLQQRSDSGT